ncbi:MAG: T9SS type A sorting domain-containing protein [Hymenobacter sp.]|nr:MAG: T9SS type A sorting domain-containing protein [Hymenobacter sp.]
MNKLIYSIGIWLFALLLALPSHAQYASTAPVRDGNISAGEYNNNSFTTANNGTWYMTWDANYLYIAKTGGQEAEPNYMYLDVDPTLPVTGGGLEKGNLTGNIDYGVTPVLPFRADVRVFFRIDNGNRYVEIRRRNGTGPNATWGNPIQTNLDFFSTGTNRELRLSWNTLTNNLGIPPTFNWLGYASNLSNGSDNYRYDQAPVNPKALNNTGGNAPLTEYYYTVLNTANGSATNPFSLKSYTFLGNYTSSTNNTIVPNDDAFGAIEVWDYTMNLADGRISRNSSTGGDWAIGGSLVVGNGVLYFGDGGNNFGNTNVGNVRVLGNGILDMNQTPKPLNVREDVDLTGGSQLVLSGRTFGDLAVGRNFYVRDGLNTTQATFQPGVRAVSFFGTGVTHTIQANNTTYQVPFSYLDLNSQSGSIVLASSIFVSKQVRFSQGLLITGNNFVQLDGAVDGLMNESAASHIVGNTRITQTLGTAQSGTKYFGNVGFVLTPQNSTTAFGDVTITRVTGTALTGVGVGNGTASIQRYFVLTSPNTTATGLDLQLQFSYRPDEQNNIPTGNLALYQSQNGAPGTFLRLTAPSASTSTTISYNYTGMLTSGTYFTLGDGVVPLPVTLVSFTATPTAQGAALLHWVTASETNSKGFTIERQLGSGSAWQQVGYVAASNAATGSTYNYTDKSLTVAPATPVAYYRLRQEDFDGATSYSPVATVARPAGVASTELLLSPVPVTGANLSVTFAEAGQAGLEIAVVNTQGQNMLHYTTVASAETALSLPVEKLAAGVYIVSVRVPGQPVRHARFVKL